MIALAILLACYLAMLFLALIDVWLEVSQEGLFTPKFLQAYYRAGGVKKLLAILLSPIFLTLSMLLAIALFFIAVILFVINTVNEAITNGFVRLATPAMIFLFDQFSATSPDEKEKATNLEQPISPTEAS